MVFPFSLHSSLYFPTRSQEGYLEKEQPTWRLRGNNTCLRWWLGKREWPWVCMALWNDNTRLLTPRFLIISNFKTVFCWVNHISQAFIYLKTQWLYLLWLNNIKIVVFLFINNILSIRLYHKNPVVMTTSRQNNPRLVTRKLCVQQGMHWAQQDLTLDLAERRESVWVPRPTWCVGSQFGSHIPHSVAGVSLGPTSHPARWESVWDLPVWRVWVSRDIALWASNLYSGNIWK